LKHVFKGILSLLSVTEKNRLFRLILLDLLISVLDIAFLGALLIIIGLYTSGTPVQHRLLQLNWLKQQSILPIGLFMLLYCGKNWLGYLITRFQHHFFYGVASRLSKRNILHYLKDEYIKFVNVDSSVHIRRVSQQPIEFSHYILNNVQQIISQSLLISFTIGAILIYQPLLFFLLLLVLLPPIIILAYFIKRKSKQVREQTKTASEKSIQYLQESLAGFIESNIYDKRSFLADRYAGYQQQLNNNIATQQTLQGLPARLVEIFAIFGFFILVLVNKWAVHGAVVDVLTIGVFITAAYKIIPGIIKILNSMGQIKTYEFTLNDLLAVKEPDALQKAGTLNIVEPISSIRFHNVCFSYADQPVVAGISFDVYAGDFVGLSAASGSGKTTIINLLLGFLTPQSGYIYIDGKQTDTHKRQQYWKKIAYVKQQNYFIHDTILKNITLTDDQEYDTAKLEEAISFCGLVPLLAGYPEGINKIVRENGKNLSGGQRQRIALARALYHDFDVLIMDEPFGEMDQQAEEAILTQLKQLTAQGKIIFFITHNIASLSHCNKIIPLINE
jgi:ABC-type multidrug transport system fused ATPase/permease subunit